MNRHLPNLELLIYKSKQELASQEAWKEALNKKKSESKFVWPDFIAEVFPQMWGSTCTGFDITQDGEPVISGAAMTEEYTTVIHERLTDFYCVFFGEHLCYVVSDANEDFIADLHNHCMASLSEARKRY